MFGYMKILAQYYCIKFYFKDDNIIQYSIYEILILCFEPTHQRELFLSNELPMSCFQDFHCLLEISFNTLKLFLRKPFCILSSSLDSHNYLSSAWPLRASLIHMNHKFLSQECYLDA